MYANVNLAAPLGVMLLLSTAFLLFVAALPLVYSIVTKRRVITRIALIALVAVAGLYLGVMLLFSFTSSEKVLARGEEKLFCELDCHLAYSVTDTHETKTVGDASHQVAATGTFRVVTVKTRFDEKTISPARGNGVLCPNPREVAVVDGSGRKYLTSTSGQSALQGSQAAGTPITTPLRPGESYTTTFVFDLPPNIPNPTLLIHESAVETRFIIGHENSLLHRKIRFQI